jgi:hypothetical protein
MFVRKIMKDKEKEPKEELPSAVDDCADVTSKHKRFKETLDKPKFPPIDYEKPPHF